jgi:hypothetical protein
VKRDGCAGPGYANRLRPKADFGGSRGFAEAFPCWLAEASAKAASPRMTVCDRGRDRFSTDRISSIR